MTLQLRVHVAAAEDTDEPIEPIARGGGAAGFQGERDRPIVAARQAH
jgi:hypothetical protein